MLKVTSPTINTVNINGCNSIVYKGNTYITSIILKDTVKSTLGCDSIFNVTNINVNKITPTTKTSIVSGCNNVVYKSIVYTSSTSVKDTLKSYQGCDSVYSNVNIVVNIITPTNNSITVNGCNSVIYKGNTYLASTLLKDTVKSYQGCDSMYNTVDIKIIKETVLKETGVKDFHHLHVWAISTTQNAMTGHVVVSTELSNEQVSQLKHTIKHELEHLNIQHATLETETETCSQEVCGEADHH